MAEAVWFFVYYYGSIERWEPEKPKRRPEKSLPSKLKPLLLLSKTLLLPNAKRGRTIVTSGNPILANCMQQQREASMASATSNILHFQGNKMHSIFFIPFQKFNRTFE